MRFSSNFEFFLTGIDYKIFKWLVIKHNIHQDKVLFYESSFIKGKNFCQN